MGFVDSWAGQVWALKPARTSISRFDHAVIMVLELQQTAALAAPYQTSVRRILKGDWFNIPRLIRNPTVTVIPGTSHQGNQHRFPLQGKRDVKQIASAPSGDHCQ
jgi:hypothetical protein